MLIRVRVLRGIDKPSDWWAASVFRNLTPARQKAPQLLSPRVMDLRLQVLWVHHNRTLYKEVIMP